ncbi:hypothetical protein BLS_008563 [Venturia inaequalis]|uniref:A-kinase anchor protein 7-like phosphoesterase domain-containing protein n=1 Tax=Venturia inaequalis TaxID=5025 RepID=A0A8H3VMJ1_VENIN|nr:hypothetical protein BLS_008563 [Venturia inaequalis]KAE9991949.1 hypothetical protein EG327_010516 [Venturia inaequalis]
MHKSRYKRGQSSGSSKQSGLPKRPPLTHFLCLPLVTEISKPQLEASLFQFQESLSTKFADGLPAVNDAPRKLGQAPRTLLIPPRAIRPVGTIHFTLGVMSLETGSRVQEAVEFLKGLDVKTMVEESLRKNDLSNISLTSLHCMHEPESTSVLYAGPGEDSNGLFQTAVSIQDLFIKQGYLIPDDRPFKLHATIVNTIYSNTYQKRSPRFNAEGLLNEWKDFLWAKDFPIEKVALCEMGAKKIRDANGEIVGEEYEEIASIPFLA